ncbi:MAG: MBL fold metallo-hydrolase [Beijerinckiaceae bacterium]|jgi:glyoxylase-like metal-dependent hydrolase (beta-lactamase superfamily II)|nr:MBL fold metallo-hydrolase [Beijerinckiaceae bacterium]
MILTRRILLNAIGTSLLAGPVLAQAANTAPADFRGKVFVTERGGVRVHTYMADPAGALVTSHLVETQAGLVLVDGQFVAASAQELKRYITSLGRPVTRVILSHMHPDHWFGLAHAGFEQVHAGPVTAKFITERGAALVAERKVETRVPAIAGTIAAGDETIGGVIFRYRPILDTEAPEILTIELPQAGILIAQDVVYNKVHAVVSRQLDQWVAALKAIETRAGEMPVILPGHGEPTAPASLGGLVGYLQAVKPLLVANIGKEDQAKAITEEIARAFPDYRIPPLLTLGLSRALKA